MQSKSPNTHAYFCMGGGWAPNVCVYGRIFLREGACLDRWASGDDDDDFNMGTMSNATVSRS